MINLEVHDGVSIVRRKYIEPCAALFSDMFTDVYLIESNKNQTLHHSRMKALGFIRRFISKFEASKHSRVCSSEGENQRVIISW